MRSAERTAEEAEGRLRRLAQPAAGAKETPDFRSALSAETAAPAATQGAARAAQVSGWAGLVTKSAADASAPDPKPAAGGAGQAASTAPQAAARAEQVSGWAGLVTKSAADASAPNPLPAAAKAEACPTAESVFGGNPWIANAAGQGPLGLYYYNPMYFATAATAARVAQMLGGKVVERNCLCSATASPFQQLQPNYMVELADGRTVNAGLVASLYTHGWSQSQVDRMIAIEAGPAPA
jgi:hypothetical protein